MVGNNLRISCRDQTSLPPDSSDWFRDIGIAFSKFVQLLLFMTILRMILENGAAAAPIETKGKNYRQNKKF